MLSNGNGSSAMVDCFCRHGIASPGLPHRAALCRKHLMPTGGRPKAPSAANRSPGLCAHAPAVSRRGTRRAARFKAETPVKWGRRQRAEADAPCVRRPPLYTCADSRTQRLPPSAPCVREPLHDAARVMWRCCASVCARIGSVEAHLCMVAAACRDEWMKLLVGGCPRRQGIPVVRGRPYLMPRLLSAAWNRAALRAWSAREEAKL